MMKKNNLVVLTFGAMLLAGGELALADCAPVLSNNNNMETIETTSSIESITQWSANSPVTIGKEMAKQNSDKTAKYQVKWGDTLSAISEASHVPLDQILSLNMIPNPNVIYVGQWINLGNSKEAKEFVKRQDNVSNNSQGTKDVNTNKATNNDDKSSSNSSSNTSVEITKESNTDKNTNNNDKSSSSDLSTESTSNNGDSQTSTSDEKDNSSVKPATLDELYKYQHLLVGYAAVYAQGVIGAEDDTWELTDFTLNRTGDATGMSTPGGNTLNSGTVYYFNSNSSSANEPTVQAKPAVCITGGETVYFGVISQAAALGWQATIQEILDYVNADTSRIQKAIEVSENL